VSLVVAVMVGAWMMPIGAEAVPIELIPGGVTKIKFTNYENWLDLNTDGIINTGDKFEGIAKAESITNLGNTINKNTQLGDGSRELTMNFQFSVVGGSITPGGSGHLDFALGAGDFIDAFVDFTPDWNLTVGNASDGASWLTVSPPSFYEGVNDTAAGVASTNRNWANATTNSTGYPIVPRFYASTAGENPAHTYLGFSHGDHLVDLYFASRLFNVVSGDPGFGTWQFKSEDPIYIWVPEPTTLLLLGGGLLGLAGTQVLRRRPRG
jgi:hypothetical protein